MDQRARKSSAARSPSQIDPAAIRGEKLQLDVQRRLFAGAQTRPLQRGESLILKGDSADAVYLVISGAMKLSATSSNGRCAVVGILVAGDMVGDVTGFVGGSRRYDACPIERTEVAMLEARDFQNALNADPVMLQAFTAYMCHKMLRAMRWIDDAIMMTFAERLAHRLLELDAQQKMPGGGNGAFSTTQEELSTMLGVSRQSINRQLRLWADAGVLKLHYRNIELLDRARLRRVLDT